MTNAFQKIILTNRFFLCKLFPIVLLTSSLSLHAQQLSVGLSGGGSWSRIMNSSYSYFRWRSNIGNDLGSFTYGASAFFYFRDPLTTKTTPRIALIYRNSDRGSVSEDYPDHKFKFNANTIGLTGGTAVNIQSGFFFYIDLGVGYNFIDNSNPYIGIRSQLDAFNSNLADELQIKSGEVVALIDFGVEKSIFKDKFKVFLGVIGDMGISTISSGLGSYRTSSIGLELGVRYVIDLKKK